jgi:hypothetical protein
MTLTARTAQTYDYTMARWGHNVIITAVHDDGKILKASGWGRGIAVGDYLLLPALPHKGSTRYQVTAIEYFRDPPDMWWATLRFAPRKA